VLDALEVLDSVGSQRAHVVGSSFGSAIAQWLAIDHAKRVATLTLSGAYARPDQHFEALADRWSEVASRATNPGELLASINVDAYGPESQEGGYAAERAEDGAQLLAGDIEAWEDFRGATITALAAALEHNSTRHLFRIDVPVLIVVGEHDAVLPLRHSEELAELIPQAQLALVPDAGHQVLEERRAEFNERLEAFLEQSRATAVATA
jgi:pimeloyl-ACP methyl ester carboxylesterase